MRVADFKTRHTNNFKVDVTKILYDNPAVAIEEVANIIGVQASAGISFKGLVQLRETMGFSELRFFCKKGDKLVDMTTTDSEKGRAVIEYFTSDVETRPDACGSFRENKKSGLTQGCSKWQSGKWGSGAKGNDRLYGNVGMIVGKHFFRMGLPNQGTTQFRCDDHGGSSMNVIGRWMIYVR